MSFDLAIIGGGINGAGIARDAAGRGWSVLMVEAGDLAQATSSASTKLIHGGLRYLEQYEFRLVGEALAERAVLRRMAPHIIWPLRFVLPHAPELRPAWMIRLGLALYDRLGGRGDLPGSRMLDLATAASGQPLKPEFRKGFEYSDCWVQDARLVVLNAIDARERGAKIRTRTRLVAAERRSDAWSLTLRDALSGDETVARARCLVNAAGPWLADILAEAGVPARRTLRLVRGSHIVTRRLFEGEQAYIFQNTDRRIVFAIPYERDFTLIGTTDVDHDGDPGDARCSDAEADYLCAAVSRYFRRPVGLDDIVWRYAGVRPLYGEAGTEARDVTRDYAIDVDAPAGAAPLIAIWGGKITTYRKLAESALSVAARALGREDRRWTRGAVLPGGDFTGDAGVLAATLMRERPWLPALLAERLARDYGTRARRILGDADAYRALGRDFGAHLSAAELDYLASEEWAMTAEDVLWRRGKLGLRLPPAVATEIDAHLAATCVRLPA